MGGLETQTCTRCGGGGQYSYCSEHGSRCFGCGGSGKQYTKRGAVAAEYLRTLRIVTVDQLQPGDKILNTWPAPKWHTIVSIERGMSDAFGYRNADSATTPAHRINCAGIALTGFDGSSTYRKAWTAEQKAEQLALAVKFQNTLTKQGKPRKCAA